MNEIQTWEEMEMSEEWGDYGTMVREFARRHCKAALEAAYKKASFTTESGVTIIFSEGFGDLNKDSILNAYSETNII